MTDRIAASLSVSFLVMGLLAAGSGAAQPAAAGAGGNAAAKPVPRANGKPDLSGIWVATGALLLFEGEEAFAAAQAADKAAGRSAPPPEPPPYKPDADAKRQYYLARRGIDDPMGRCLLTGVGSAGFGGVFLPVMVPPPGKMIALHGYLWPDHADRAPTRAHARAFAGPALMPGSVVSRRRGIHLPHSDRRQAEDHTSLSVGAR